MDEIKLSRLIKCPHSKGSFKIHWSDLNRFVQVLWKIPFYHLPQSKKVFPMYLQELSDLNPDNSGFKKLFPGSHPFFRHVSFLQYFIAWKDGQTVGRIAAYIDENYHEEDVPDPIGWIGLFECIECPVIADKLLEEAISILQKQGVTKIIGPAKFNANGEVGLLIDGFEYHPMMMEPYHPPYYQSYFSLKGKKENDWFGFHIDTDSIQNLVQRINKLGKSIHYLKHKLGEEGISIRPISYLHFFRDTEKIRQLYNQAWNTTAHPQFENFNKGEFNYIAKGLKAIAQKEWVLLAEDCQGQNPDLIAFSVMIPDLNELISFYDHRFKNLSQSSKSNLFCWILRDLAIYVNLKQWLKHKKFSNARIFILGSIIKKRGLDALLYEQSYHIALKYNIKMASGSQIADINLEMINPLKRMGKVSFLWRVYRFDI